MAVGIPLPTNYSDGDVWSASDVNDITGTINTLGGGNFAAGKNKIINGDFFFNQRAFTSTTTTNTYGFDRFIFTTVDGTSTYSAQTFTLGTAPVVGYEGKNFARVASTGQTLTSAQTLLSQRIESVRTFANQTATVSFWAKSGSGTPKVAVELVQRFGTGGSPSSNVNTYGAQVTLSTSWARYTVTFTVPSISGKTLGTANDDNLALNLWTSAGSDFNTRTGSLGIQTTTIDLWGVQIESGSTATAFQTATGTIQGELAACQRYYQRNTVGTAFSGLSLTGSAGSTTAVFAPFSQKVTMRVNPTSIDFTTLLVSADELSSSLSVSSAVIAALSTADTVVIGCVVSGATQFRPYRIFANNTTGFIGVSAEL
jgi:hypothetical protein